MSTNHAVIAHADDGTMTVAELRLFLDDIDDVAGIDGAPARPKVRIAFSGGIKSITVDITCRPADADTPPDGGT